MKEGRAGEIIGRILDEIKPEAVYFIEQDGKRGGQFVMDLTNASEMPKFAEPFSLVLMQNVNSASLCS